ncbi:MAG: ClbS/DfsB family four-helix bundle protein [Clostridia bacterium]|nr:ClbS/DfsB family four-helix bundle protein [Clostridia bacterium]
MARPRTKEDLISESEKSYKNLCDFISALTEKELGTEFDFSSLNKSEAHWKRDKNLRDVLMHLYEWQMLMLRWVSENEQGRQRQFLRDGYSWANYGEMNMLFFQSAQDVPLEKARELLSQSHSEITALMQKYDTKQLFEKNVFAWVGGSTLGQYFISTTIAHYEWALKKLKAHRKIVAAL